MTSYATKPISLVQAIVVNMVLAITAAGRACCAGFLSCDVMSYSQVYDHCACITVYLNAVADGVDQSSTPLQELTVKERVYIYFGERFCHLSLKS